RLTVCLGAFMSYIVVPKSTPPVYFTRVYRAGGPYPRLSARGEAAERRRARSAILWPSLTKLPEPSMPVRSPRRKALNLAAVLLLLAPDTGKPQVATTRKCADPTVEMREKMETLKKKGCQFAPLKRNSDRYISSWVCQTPNGAMRFRDVLLAKDADSYEDLSETHTRQRVMQQRIEAARRGECPGIGSGAPLTPTRKPPRRP